LTSHLSEGLIRTLIGSIAQLVEQGIENPCVPGSIPGRATTDYKKPRLLKRNWVFYCLSLLLHNFHNKFLSPQQHLSRIIPLFRIAENESIVVKKTQKCDFLVKIKKIVVKVLH
tara:strand:+ start:10380 stop:10721 length:342 start_codon:yes stop_codon:yes gene_type:complete